MSTIGKLVLYSLFFLSPITTQVHRLPIIFSRLHSLTTCNAEQRRRNTYWNCTVQFCGGSARPVCPEEWCTLQSTSQVTLRYAQVDLLLWIVMDLLLLTALWRSRDCEELSFDSYSNKSVILLFQCLQRNCFRPGPKFTLL